MITYVDTSTIIKLIIHEPGSDRAQLIWDNAEALTTVRLTAAEARATVAAAARSGRLTASQHASAINEVGLLWSSLHVIEVTAELVDQAGDLAATHSLRGYDAVHLAAAITAGAEVLTSADTRLCAAAQAEGMHVLNPLDAPMDERSSEQTQPDLERLVLGVRHDLAATMTGDSGVYGIPMPAAAPADPARIDFVLASGLGAIEDLVAFYREWMAVDGWIFDADYGERDPYAMEQRKLGGYFVQLLFVKPTRPPTTVGITIGNADGRPGHKQHVTINIGVTPDDELPRRSLQLGPHHT
jgi:predicted nucleic acid-binding protein